MSKSRAIKRKKELAARKAARKASKEVSKALARAPKSCTSCAAVFDNSNSKMLDSWTISTYPDGSFVLLCQNCKDSFTKNETG